MMFKQIMKDMKEEFEMSLQEEEYVRIALIRARKVAFDELIPSEDEISVGLKEKLKKARRIK